MVDTAVSSAKREVVIGFDRPFCVIGERINPTGRKLLAAEMAWATTAGLKAMRGLRWKPVRQCWTERGHSARG